MPSEPTPTPFWLRQDFNSGFSQRDGGEYRKSKSPWVIIIETYLYPVVFALQLSITCNLFFERSVTCNLDNKYFTVAGYNIALLLIKSAEHTSEITS